MTPVFFATPAELRRWFDQHHESAKELFLGYYKVGDSRPSVTWPESVEEALCFGWIDGIRRSLGADSYMIRFTPRKSGSIWSAVNIRLMEKLIAEGRMRPEGLAAFDRRKEDKSGIYSHEQQEIAFSADYQARFHAEREAWDLFQQMPNSYRKAAIWWVMGAKQEATREKRLAELIADSAAGRKVKQFRRPGDKS